jgi:hypothetical protein
MYSDPGELCEVIATDYTFTEKRRIMDEAIAVNQRLTRVCLFAITDPAGLTSKPIAFHVRGDLSTFS